MQLSILESRLLHNLPEEEHKTVKKEFSKFEMETSRLAQKPDKYGQATLTSLEIDKAVTTNQHGDYGHTIIELQTIKGVAVKLGVKNWLKYVDPKLTHEENMKIMEEQADPTVKELNAREKAKARYK